MADTTDKPRNKKPVSRGGSPGTPTGQVPMTAPRLRKVAVFTVRGIDARFQEDRVVRVHKERIVVGSVVSADVRLPGEGVEPIHAVIELYADPMNPDQPASLFDLASGSGVYVNGRKIVTSPLTGGETIRIGAHELKFRIDDIEKYTSRERIRNSEGRSLFLNPHEDLTPLNLTDEREVDEIFDYRPTQRPSVEVVMSWRGSILDVQHFVAQRSVTLGTTPRGDFGVPPLLSSPHFPLITRSGDSFTLNLDTQMKGVMQRKGKLLPLSQVRDEAARGPNGYQLVLEKDDFAKISVGEVDFYLSFTAAPPRLKRQRVLDRDPFLIKILASSMIFTLTAIVALLNVRVPKNLEAEELPKRIATILYQPEKYIEPPKHQRDESVPALLPDSKVPKTRHVSNPPPPPRHPEKVIPKPPVETPPKHEKLDLTKELPKQQQHAKQTSQAHEATHAQKQGSAVAQNRAREGEGARAKGAEGQRGSKTSKTQGESQNRATRPSPDAGHGAGGSHSQVNGEGTMDAFKDAAKSITNLLESSSERLGKGGEKVAGFGGFDTQGKGGLALSGNGSGGGGTADTLAGGLGKKGTGGGRVGTGLGAAGNGDGIAGGKVRVVLRTGGAEETVVLGAIDPEEVKKAILAHQDEFRYCHEKEINAGNPKLAGTVIPSWTIGARGTVTQAGIASSTIGNSNVEKCVLNVLRRIQFPEPKGGGDVEVRFGFKFRAAGG